MQSKRPFFVIAGSQDDLTALIALGGALAIPSLSVAKRYGGAPGVALYLALLIPGLALVWRPGWRWLQSRRRGTVVLLLATTFLATALLVILLYPLADSGVAGGGSDRDDALDLGARSLLDGRYPYYERTYLGNPISPLPGALLLAVPWQWLGGSGYQSLLWLALLALAVARRHNLAAAIWLLWVMLGLAPAALNELLTGGDLLANNLYVLLASAVLLHAWTARPPDRLRRLLTAVALGIALASRANYWLLLPLVGGALAARVGWRTAVSALGVVTAVTLSLTLPFFLYDPAAFTPIGTINELAAVDTILPGASRLLPLAAGLLALLLARPAGRSPAHFLASAAVVQAAPVLGGMLLAGAGGIGLGSGFATFGLNFLPLAAVAALEYQCARQRPPIAPTLPFR